MSEITHTDYMNLVARIEKLEAFMKRELSRQVSVLTILSGR